MTTATHTSHARQQAYLNDPGPFQAQDAPGNRSFPSVTKWLAQAILSDAIKMGVGRLVTNSHGIHAIIRARRRTSSSSRNAGQLEHWSPSHQEFRELFSKKKKHARAREAGDWIRTLGLDLTPELEAVLSDPLMHLMGHDALLGLTQQECNIRVMGVGSVLFQLLAVQHELGEPLNLNGDLIEDLKDDSVVACRPDGDEALNAMFSAIPTTSTESNPILVVVKGVLKRKKNEEIKAEKPAKRAKPEPKKERKRGGTRRGATKRKAHDEIDDEKPTKRARTHQKKAQEGPSKSAKNPPASRPTTRRTGAGKR
ncbi:hypothetical protein K438DRAFT_1782180 [Mycena galopus ATCC 62051]|nr:hypothetical protein K438DRAFT_1782180 [Mycena galopus ATCC 62051]